MERSDGTIGHCCFEAHRAKLSYEGSLHLGRTSFQSYRHMNSFFSSDDIVGHFCFKMEMSDGTVGHCCFEAHRAKLSHEGLLHLGRTVVFNLTVILIVFFSDDIVGHCCFEMEMSDGTVGHCCFEVHRAKLSHEGSLHLGRIVVFNLTVILIVFFSDDIVGHCCFEMERSDGTIGHCCFEAHRAKLSHEGSLHLGRTVVFNLTVILIVYFPLSNKISSLHESCCIHCRVYNF
jgi:hypothetical protein